LPSLDYAKLNYEEREIVTRVEQPELLISSMPSVNKP